ncbi:SEC10/PgrA surface exclusion domain-containing protein [Limosilactobacillus sp. STM2_1]|uniref:SEC10/PgrA surface exclusion domain-containing protein n=1 Tax=Limosilactobacillus rudii TaxID=2759755 RepID=A0A7W3YP79_9LACO|nr:SEC10/PgrA surface exclusion domain-containing protein [Limosilactobacillus rudii]MBB1079274.1 SEC10/PgrA surface exclusion domain-containing protein [Limosilactobacillus rudii]MBB1098266.1 SEC10/PgrA surface exclusion domain-containing protein [Limosilactobacillus rudii]MCD7134344.1 SEC10/PgrA surface exclusion domain-containing protein [Limosilactobacillus rudii]
MNKKENAQLSRIAYRNQLKSHKKLYKSGKNWMAATLLTAGVIGGVAFAGNTNVHADATTPAQDTGTIEAPAQNSELQQAQADAQAQQKAIDNGNADLANQQQQLSNLQSQQTAAQQALDQAKQAQQQATANDPAVQQAQADYNKAQQQVNGQTTKVEEDNNAVQQAQSEVDKANAEAQQQQQEADQKVQQAQDTVKQSINQTVEKTKQDDQNKIAQLENQGKAQANQQLNDQISDANGQFTDAQNKVNDTNSQISNLQGQVQDLQNQQSSSQTDSNIKQVPNGYIDYSKSLLENVSRNNLWAPADMNANANGNIVEQNLYISPDNDKGNLNYANPNHGVNTSLSQYDNYYSTKFDGVNGKIGMTDAQKQELAILMMNQINHAREQRGLKPFTMTEQKYNQAQIRAAQPSAETLTHSENDIVSAFGQDQYENLAYIPFSGTTNMLSLLSDADSTLSSMLNADASSDWGHRENFLMDTGDLSYDAAFGIHLTSDGQYYVLTFDYDGPAHNNTPNMMDRIANYAAMGPITPSANTVDNSAKINNLNSQINNLKNALASQQAEYNQAQAKLQDLQAKKANVQFDLSQLTASQQDEYNKAKDDLANLDTWKSNQLANINENSIVKNAQSEATQIKNAANQKVKDAKNAFNNALSVKKQDEKDLKSLEQDLDAKQTKLDKAKAKVSANTAQAVKNAQAKLDSIKNQIKDLNNKIATTKANISQAQVLLAQANKKIQDLQNATNPSTPAKGDDNKGSETPTQPAKPDEGNKDHGTTPAKPSNPSKGDDKGTTTTPTKPSTPTKSDDNKNGETPTQPTTPAKPDTGNASISNQAGHKPAKSDSSEATKTATPDKPTIVLPTTGSESATSAGSQGQYINVVSKDTAKPQAGIEAPVVETINVSFGTKTEPMTREEYKAQQAKLPQTGNENSKAVIALGVLSGMFGLGLVAKSKKEF